MPTTQLNYNIVPDKSPLYTTVDQLNQSITNLQVTAQNSTTQPVTVSEILIELVKVESGADTVELLLPGSAGGIQIPNTLTGPGQSTWTVTSPSDGQFRIKAAAGVTFHAGDTLALTLTNVVIREGGTGTAFVPVHEASGAGPGQTEVGIGITQSTLSVQLSVPQNELLIEPNGTATLIWSTADASSGSLTMPGNSPSSLTLEASNLVSGQQPVSPIGDTTYTLTCEGLGPNVSRQVTVNVDSLQMGPLEGSADMVILAGQLLLQWRTNADSCTLDDATGNSVSVPPNVPNATYPNGYSVNPEKPTTYTLNATKKLGNGDFVDDSRTKDVQVFGIASFSSSASAFAANETITLTWVTFNADSCTLSTEHGTGSVTLPVSNGQQATCSISATPDGQTLIVTTGDASNQELGRLTLPTPSPSSADFVLTATGSIGTIQAFVLVGLTPPQIQFTTNIGSRTFRPRSTEGFMETVYWLEVAWNVNNASSVQVMINGSQYSNAVTGSWTGGEGDWDPPQDTATITCTGFGGPVSQS